MAAMVGQSNPGEKARLTVWRKGKKQELIATLGSSSEDVAQKADADEAADQGKFGLAVRPLTPQEREAAKVAGGLVVEGVNGPAARAGVAPGDIVLQAGGKPVHSVEDLREATRSSKTVALLVQRGNQRLFVPLQTG
jgi:serine protease Do